LKTLNGSTARLRGNPMSDFWKTAPPLIQPWLNASTAVPNSETGGGGSNTDGGGYLPGPARIPVEFPRHLYPPAGVDTLDFRIVRQMDPGEEFNLIDFTPQLFGIQANTYITQYAVFNDGLLEANFAFQPTLNGNRIYPFHGNPAFNPPLISLGLAPDEANYALINGFLTMNPQDRLVWRAFNKDVVSVAMGVRVVGYVDQTSKRVTTRFGG
jgi:hypothetical protein